MGNEPELVMVDGDIVMADGRMRHVDEEDVMQNARVCARALTRRARTEALADRSWFRAR